jgi:hypothetical protein
VPSCTNEKLRTQTAPENRNLLDKWHYLCRSLQLTCLRAQHFGDKYLNITEMSARLTLIARSLLPHLLPANTFNAVRTQSQTSPDFREVRLERQLFLRPLLAVLTSTYPVMSRYRIS